MILWSNRTRLEAAGSTIPVWRPLAAAAPAILFFNWLAAGGGAPVWWREYPTPAYTNLMPRTPAAHLRSRRGRRRRAPAAARLEVSVVEGQLVVEPPRLAEALRRLYRRRLRVPSPPVAQAELDLRESDEEFLVVAGYL